ncbi:MAG TPA: hypothetical protein VKR83_06710 [Ktedonobacteraceae bacterium]|nr:hypothetical protein [Ktedonobacteraceae bacterium]
MKEQEEQQRDDLDIKITNLDGTEPTGAAQSRVRFFARRYKRPLTIAMVVMTALAILLILVNTSAVRELADKLLTRPTPASTAILYPGADLFYVQAFPSWGQLTIDGHAYARLPVIQVDAPLQLARGQHTLVWSAAPFQPQQCILSVPANFLVDTCSDKSAVDVGPDISAYIVSFSESLTLLPLNQRSALIKAVQAELDMRQSTEIVQTGELYALPASDSACKPAPGEPHCYAVAGQPLQATLRFKLVTNLASNATCSGPEPGCTFMGQSCYAFCPTGASDPGAASIWNVLAVVLPYWSFATLDDHVLESDVPDDSLWDFETGQTMDVSLMEFHITWDNQAWHVDVVMNMNVTSFIPLNPVCAAAQNMVQLPEPPANPDDGGNPLYLQWQNASGDVAAAGCVEVGKPQQYAVFTPTPTRTPPLVVYFLQRFGVMLAANEEAHRLWPYWPVANTFEQHLASQLATNMNGN